MTDNEIVEILDKCLSNGDCTDECSCVRLNAPCAYNEKNILGLIDIIKRQQAEISQLWEDCDYFEDKVKTIKSETITEFAERLKATIAGLEVKSPNVIYKGGMEEALYYRMPTIIELLVKEMTEGNNGA